MQVLDADKLLPVFDVVSFSAFKVFQVPAIIVIKQKYCRHICSQTKCKCNGCRWSFASNGCIINLFIWIYSSFCNYRSKAKRNADKLNASFISHKLSLRIVCSNIPCIQSVSNACTYCINQQFFRHTCNQIKYTFGWKQYILNLWI